MCIYALHCMHYIKMVNYYNYIVQVQVTMYISPLSYIQLFTTTTCNHHHTVQVAIDRLFARANGWKEKHHHAVQVATGDDHAPRVQMECMR